MQERACPRTVRHSRERSDGVAEPSRAMIIAVVEQVCPPFGLDNGRITDHTLSNQIPNTVYPPDHRVVSDVIGRLGIADDVTPSVVRIQYHIRHPLSTG